MLHCERAGAIRRECKCRCSRHSGVEACRADSINPLFALDRVKKHCKTLAAIKGWFPCS